jgi:hypothetical protein
MKTHKPNLQKAISSRRESPQKISCRFVMKTHKPNLQEAVSSRRESPQKISCRFVTKKHKPNLQEAVSSRKNMNQNRLNCDSYDYGITLICAASNTS